MPTKPKPRITAWSFSRYNTYDQCPFKLKCQAIDKLKEPPNKYMLRGREVHNEAEDYVTGKIPEKMPTALENFTIEFEGLRRKYEQGKIWTEDKWPVDKYWEPVEWFAPNVWLRVMVDMAEELSDTELLIVDYKTGKPADGYDAQLELYAATAFSVFEGLDRVYVELWYLDHGEIQAGPEGGYTRDQHTHLKKEWQKRIRKMMNDTRFAPKPNKYCYNCHYRAENGGPCEF